MTEQSKELNQLLIDIFEDEIVAPQEREALNKFTESMGAAETLEVFQGFLKAKWGEAIADGILTPSEVRLLGHIMVELNLDLEHLPPQARLALKDTV